MSIQKYPEIIFFCLEIIKNYQDEKIISQSARFLSNLIYFIFSNSKYTQHSNKSLLKKIIPFNE